MKKSLLILFIAIFSLLACDQPLVEKPENLIRKKLMIEMLVDIHLAEATFIIRRGEDENVRSSSSAEFYYSILEKYEVADSVFEQSFVFYASDTKEFEQIYTEVMNRLSQIEQEFSGRKNELLEFEEEQ